jgi:hypothetical protein
MSHIHFDQYDITSDDLIYLPPETLKGGNVTQQRQNLAKLRRGAIPNQM